MNERVKELAEQRGLTGPNFLVSSQELEKFALLIVKECAEQIAKWTPSKTENDFEKGVRYAYEEAVIVIKEHFGVE